MAKQLIKIEKDFCPACDIVEAILKEHGAEYSKLNIQASGTPDKEKEADTAREYLAEIGLFTVPVTILVEDKKVVDFAKGADREKLAEFAEAVR